MRWIAPFFCCVSLLVGCGRSDSTLMPVRGRVFYRGQPLSGGTIVFTPDPRCGGRGPQAWAQIESDGRYSLRTDGKTGAASGWHLVTVAALDKGVRLPTHYRDPEQSGRRFEVRPDRETPYDLHLD